ncbi:MAG: tetratricopeptide repeat protein [Caldilineaceae bacterium]
MVAGTTFELHDEAEFTAQVNDALKEYDSVLSLARLPLANSPLVAPLLVLDDVSPTAEERGHALRLMIRWAVERLAPATTLYPFGRERPFDDPAWSDSRWWRYNILRHRYLEPLHPDQFVEGGRYTETLIALTGIPSTDTFFDERNRAIREVARWLRQQWLSGQANDELQRLALNEVYRQLEKQPVANQLLAIAATFDDVFPSQLLRQMATEERLDGFDLALTWLTQNRFLSSGDDGALLSLSSILQRDLYVRQPTTKLERRHRQIADWYLASQNIVASVRHRQKARQWPDAATTLLAAADDLVNELQLRELTTLLQAFPPHVLSNEQWREVQIRFSDMLALTGSTEQALAACRRALKVTEQPSQQARIYRRMGKLYEVHNQLHALNYYQQAVERFETTDSELVDLLKDRAWIYILREEWNRAESDLNLALANATAASSHQLANIYDALSYLYGRRQQYLDAIQHARRSLALREENGDLLRVADSFGILGLLYMRMGEFINARSAHQDALKIYHQIDNRPKIASTLLNIGMAFHLDKRFNEAIGHYEESLQLCHTIGLPLVESKAYSNLVEAYIDTEQLEEAKQYWRQGYSMAIEKELADEVAYYEELRARFPFLKEVAQEAELKATDNALSSSPLALEPLNPDEMIVMNLTLQRGKVTASDLIEELHLSRATATRRLAGLVEKGYLQSEGKGRGSYYRLVEGLKNEKPRQKSPVVPPGQHKVSAAEVRAILDAHRQELTHRYSLEALGIVDLPEPPLPASKLVVRFQHLPDLPRYFELKEYLGQLLRADVDILLDSQQSTATPSATNVLWL